ncbi:MAG: type IV pilus assembly protein PilM [Dehalobacterium sp.]
MLNKITTQFQKRLHKKEKFLGIDIGTRDIKMVEIAAKSQTQIISMGRIPTPQGAVDDGAIVQVDQVADTLRSLVAQSGTQTRKAVTIISGKNVITRYIKLPKMSEKEVASTLKWDADKYIPLSSGTDLIIEHLVLGDTVEDGTPQVNVLLVAVPRRLVYLIHETFAKADLSLTAVEIEPLSLWRSIGSNVTIRTGAAMKRQDSFIGLDIGAKASNLVVFQGEELKFSRYITIGGDELTNRLVKSLNLEFNAAQLIKERDGRLFIDKEEALSPEKEKLYLELREGFFPLVAEIRRSMEFYRSQFKQSNPQDMIITGGSSKLKGIVDFFQQELGLTVIPGLQNFTIQEEAAAKNHEMNQIDPAFAVAIGLALREV